MIVVRRFPTRELAEQAINWLDEAGISAFLDEPTDTVFGSIAGRTGYGVAIPDPSREPLASELLTEFAESAARDPIWSDLAVDLDFSKVDPRLPFPCPGCQYPLRGLPRTGNCPECGTLYDLAEVIILAHGPEALVAATKLALPGDKPEPIARNCPCPKCQYSLRGLPPSGRCPECGEPYKSDDLLRFKWS